MVAPLLLALQVATCGSCTIRAVKAVVLSDRAGLAGLSHPTGIARTRTGHWVVTHAGAPERIHLFAPDGSFVRAVGRAGAGPGEYRAATLATIGPGDSVWIYDQSLRRVSVLDRELRYGRSFPLPVPSLFDLAVLGDGRMVIAAEFRTADRVGLPLHVIDAAGRLSAGFGSLDRTFRADHIGASRRSFWPADSSSVWIADVVRYRLQRWTIGGTLQHEIVRSADWFVAHNRFWYPRDIRAEPHPPGLVSVHQDTTGLLWTIVHVPDPEWRTAIGPRRDIRGRASVGVLNRGRYLDSVVEAIDPASGRVLASARMDAVVTRFVHDRMAFQYIEEAETGEPMIVVWRFELATR